MACIKVVILGDLTKVNFIIPNLDNLTNVMVNKIDLALGKSL